jgi:hypothetical protein
VCHEPLRILITNDPLDSVEVFYRNDEIAGYSTVRQSLHFLLSLLNKTAHGSRRLPSNDKLITNCKESWRNGHGVV